MAEIIVTGGTLDKDYDEVGQRLYFPGESCVPEILVKARMDMMHTVRVLMQIDSNDMTTRERRRIADYTRNAEAEKIVITHGTDTMAKTGAFLLDEEIDKTVVLTGAVRPYRFGNSDAEANLMYALGVAELAPSGVYVAMNGRVFSPRNVIKDLDTAVFRRIEE